MEKDFLQGPPPEITSVIPFLFAVIHGLFSYIHNTTPYTSTMTRHFLSLAIFALFLTGGCKKEPILSPEAEAIKLLITQDINDIEDLMHFKVYDTELEVIFSAWNSDQVDGKSYVEVELQELIIRAIHDYYNEDLKVWGEDSIDISYEDIDNYLIQNNKMLDPSTGATLRVGNNVVIYLKASAN